MVGRGTSPMIFVVYVEQHLLGSSLDAKNHPLRLKCRLTDRQTHQTSHLRMGRCSTQLLARWAPTRWERGLASIPDRPGLWPVWEFEGRM